MNTTESKEKLIADFKVVVADAEALLQATASETGEKLGEARAKLEKRLEEARGRLREAEGVLRDKGQVAADAADGFVRDNPWKSVGIAAGFGLVIGMLIGRR
ncbi:MAG: DUF883 domain-containing protein [Burkholderiales bacterium]|nr:DUF883 domain-containing protein [Burkholderiales bacterium]